MDDLEFTAEEQIAWESGYDAAINEGAALDMPGSYRGDWRAVFWSFGFAAGQEELANA